MKRTEDQQAAIETRGCNILVSAGAGAGKTFVLVERVISWISDAQHPVDIDRLLVVTFTKAAADEMRERIGLALSRKMAEEGAKSHLRRQLRLLNKAHISTLHSFCLEVLRQNFQYLNIDPSFRVADETESLLLKEEAIEKVFEQRYEMERSTEENRLFTSLVDIYGGPREDVLLKQLIFRLDNFSRSTLYPQRWLDGLTTDFSTKKITILDDFPWMEELKADLGLKLKGVRQELETAWRLSCLPHGPGAYTDILEEDLKMLDNLVKACKLTWEEMHKIFMGINFLTLPRLKDERVDPLLKDKVKSLRDGAKKKARELVADYFFRAPGEMLADLKRMAPLRDALVRLVKDFSLYYKQVKLERGVVDFGDLEHYALEILSERDQSGNLSPSLVALEYRKKFLEVLVDEYQDINEVQEAILQLVSCHDQEKPNLFMVGDPKQSIYRFRLAEPRLFQEKYRVFSSSQNRKELKLDLRENFRSRKNIINAVNFVFRQLMTLKVGEMDYDRRAELVYGAVYPPESEDQADRSVEVHLIERKFEQQEKSESQNLLFEEEEPEEELQTAQLEARLIAARIKEMINGGFTVYDRRQDKERFLEYRDIVILLRAAKGWAQTFLEEFRCLGVPAYTQLSSGYFALTEIETVIALLKIIDNPRQDIPLAAVLRSPMFGLTAAELAKIRLFERRGDYWEAVRMASQKATGALAVKLNQFINSLERWRTSARRGNLANLIWDIYRETGYFDYAGGLPAGARRQANLRALYTRAQQYEASSFRGLFRFLRFLERFQEQDGDLGEAPFLNENEDVVRVMSIHKSKGLEYPVVFVAGLGKKFNFRDLNHDVLLHKRLGLGLEFIDSETRIKYPTLAKLAVQGRLHLEYLAEEMRILYVAMTRAREKLFLVGTVGDLERSAFTWCKVVAHMEEPLPEEHLAGAKNYLDWIGSSLVREAKGDLLRKTVGMEGAAFGKLLESTGCFRIRFWSAGDPCLHVPAGELPNSKEVMEMIRNWKPVVGEGQKQFQMKVEQVLTWDYPYRTMLDKPAKVAVTEVKSQFGNGVPEDLAAGGWPTELRNVRNAISRRPAFLQRSRGLSPGEYGGAMHLVMQHLDLKGVFDSHSVARQVEGMLAKELLTEEQAQAIDISLIVDFFQSELGKRVLTSTRVMREVPFSLVLPAGELYTDLRSSTAEKVLVQGVLDCLFFEKDGAVILDYKTDRVTFSELRLRVAFYRGQLNLYSKAVQTILKQPVKQKFLYFFTLNKWVEV